MMRTITGILKRLLTLLAAGSTSVLIAACYGVPNAYDHWAWTMKTKDRLGTPIAGLRVTVRNHLQPGAPDILETLYTNTAGVTEFTYNGEYGPFALRDSTFMIVVDDIDSTLNGGPYRQAVRPLPASISDTVFVTMEP